MDSSTSYCFLCEDAFDVDDLQKFQPGFVLDWRSNLELKLNKIPAHPGPSGPPRPRIIDIAGAQNHPHFPDPEDGLVIRPPQERRRKKKFGDGHECEYDRFAADGRCLHCLEEHSSCDLANERLRCGVCHRVAEICPEEESKSFHLACRLLELYKSQPRPARPGVLGQSCPDDSARPLKVIVFSQFRAALNFVGDRLLRRFGTACIAEYFGKHRIQELHKFTSEKSCFCLLLTKDGAEGLDLSFVTNIVFLEHIYDTSLSDQAVARAWRMGARGRVEVETLIASNSVEATMGEQMSYRGEDDTKGAASSGDQQRLKSLIQSLRLITDYHHFSKPDGSTRDENKDRSTSSNCLKRPLQLLAPQEPTPATKRAKRVVQFSLPG
jgi:Helicase conserved C-terminal domain